MNRKLLMPIAAAVLAVAAIMPAKGWNGVGHSVIAYIAEQHLTPEAKEKCRGYLHHTLPYYASWMDYWRNCPGFEATSKTHGRAGGRNVPPYQELTRKTPCITSSAFRRR